MWWLSSGDRAAESRVWRSQDDGKIWQEVTAPEVSIACHPRMARSQQAVHRHTDLIILRDQLIWATDDWLGAPADLQDAAVTFDRRVGARVMASPKTNPLQPRVLGYIGNPARSIVDAGAAYFILTESKQACLTRPQVFILSKSEPYLLQEIFTVDRFADYGTGFTYSRASRMDKNGRFFSFRNSTDVANGGPRILQWDVEYA